MQTKRVRLNGKTWDLPEVVYAAEGMLGKPWFYKVLEYRIPQAGEYYLSGAIVRAYKAPAGMSSSYLIVELTVQAMQKHIWVPVEE